MEQNYRQWDLDYKKKRDRYWTMLRKAYKDYEENTCHGYYEPTLEAFNKLMLERYGVRVNMVAGDIDGSFQIIDDAKYMLFLLKYD
jgi:predicted YcjX-like family ATPase